MLSNNWFVKILIKYFKKIIKWYNIAKSTRCYLIYIYMCVCVWEREKERERERERERDNSSHIYGSIPYGMLEQEFFFLERVSTYDVHSWW